MQQVQELIQQVEKENAYEGLMSKTRVLDILRNKLNELQREESSVSEGLGADHGEPT